MEGLKRSFGPPTRQSDGGDSGDEKAVESKMADDGAEAAAEEAAAVKATLL